MRVKVCLETSLRPIRMSLEVLIYYPSGTSPETLCHTVDVHASHKNMFL